MNNLRSASNSPWVFFLLVFLLSVPFWLAAPIAEQLLQGEVPVDLPISALMFVNPLIAALLLVYRESGSDGVKELLKRTVDYRRITRKIWYVPIVGWWPVAMVLVYGLMRLVGASLPDDPQFPILMIPVLLIVFFISATFEQLGWTGYAHVRLLNRWNALEAGIIVGVVWGVWHIVPLLQTDRPPAWIVWQVLGMIPFRILIVWLYSSSGKSVFATIVFHAMGNVSQFMFPNYGSHYDPFFAWLVLALTAVAVTYLWGPESLARYRYARLSGSDARR